MDREDNSPIMVLVEEVVGIEVDMVVAVVSKHPIHHHLVHSHELLVMELNGNTQYTYLLS
jgi:hypothetical protein